MNHAGGELAATRLQREVFRFNGRLALAADSQILALFDGPARAIRCAESLLDSNSQMAACTRAVLHTGMCERAAGAAAGYAVRLASRMLAGAPNNGVIVSRVVKDLVAGSGIRFAEFPPFYCDEVGESWPLFTVASAD